MRGEEGDENYDIKKGRGSGSGGGGESGNNKKKNDAGGKKRNNALGVTVTPASKAAVSLTLSKRDLLNQMVNQTKQHRQQIR